MTIIGKEHRMRHFLIQYRPPRATFVDDATPQESAVIEQHFRYLNDLFSDGSLQLRIPTNVTTDSGEGGQIRSEATRGVRS